MQTAVRTYQSGQGWSEPLPEMDSPNTLILAFGDTTVMDDPAPIRELRERFPSGRLLGCSTSGQIVEDAIEDGGVAALFLWFEHTQLRSASTSVGSASASREVGAELGRRLTAPDLHGVFVLSDGLGVNGAQLVEGLRHELPETVCITGGLAGAGDRFQRTWVCADGEPTANQIAAVGLSGEHARMWHGSQGGWDVFGPERRITRSRDNVLYELDHKPALEIYEQYLGDKASELPASALLFPLAIWTGPSVRPLVRTVLSISREDCSMTFAGDMPQGARAQLMRANFDDLVDGAAQASAMIPLEDPAVVAACVPISCVGRRLALRHRAEDELEEVVSTLSWCRSHVGFYSYGEISPIVGSSCELHNQTMTLTIFGETAPGAKNAPDSQSAAA